MEDNGLVRKTIISISADTMEAGKSTFCHIFKDEASKSGIEISELHFAEPLKRTLASMMNYASGIDAEILYKHMCDNADFKAAEAEPVSVFGGKTVRELLQLMGTEFGRELINPNIWTEMLKAKAQLELAEGADIILVDDTRFINEYKMLERFCNEKGLQFLDVFISRDTQKKINEAANIQRHKSEGELYFLKYSAKVNIDNDSTLCAYKAKVREISREIIYMLQCSDPKNDDIANVRYLTTDAGSRFEKDRELIVR